MIQPVKHIISQQQYATFGFIFFLTLSLLLAPLVTISNFLCEGCETYAILEDFDEKEERSEKKELEELTEVILILEFLQKKNVKTDFFANEDAMLDHLALCIEVATPPPEFPFLS